MTGINGGGFKANVGADPEISADKAVIRIAIKMDHKSDYVEWTNLTVWGKNFDWLAKNCRKGDRVVVTSSRLTTRYDEAKGQKFVNLSCNLADLDVIPKAAKAGAGDDGDLPF